MRRRNQRGLKFTLENEAKRVFGWLVAPLWSLWFHRPVNHPLLVCEICSITLASIYICIYLSICLCLCGSSSLFLSSFLWNSISFFLSLSLSLSLEAMMMLVIVLVECEIWGIVERVRFPWRGDPDCLFVTVYITKRHPFVAAMAMRVPFLCLIRALSEPPPFSSA